MGLTGSDGVAVERRVDLASLFCMIGRHGPAVALAVFAVVSVLAGYVIYRAVRRRKTEEEKHLPAGGDGSAQAGLEAARAAASTGVTDDDFLDVKQEDEETETQPQVRQRRAAVERDSWLCSPPQTDIRAPVSHHDTSPHMQTVQSWSMEPDVIFEEPGLTLQSAVAEVQEEDAEVCSSSARVDAVKDEEIPRSSLAEPPEICHEEHDQPRWDLVTDEGISMKNSTQEGNLQPLSQVVYMEEPLVLEEYVDQDKQDIGSTPETETVELNTTHTSLENVNRHQNNLQEEERTNEVIQAKEDDGDQSKNTAVGVDAQSEEHLEQEDHSLACNLETDVLHDEPVESCLISVRSEDKPSVPIMVEELVDELVSRITSDALGSFDYKSTNDQPRKVEVPTLDEDVEPPMPSDQSQSVTGMTESGSTTVEDEEPVEHMSKPHVLVYDDQQSVQEMNQFEPPMTLAQVQNMIENDSTTVEDEEPVEHMSKPHVLVYDDQQSVQEMNQFEPPMPLAQVQNMTENDSTTVEDEEPVEHRSIPHVLGDDDQQSIQEMNQFEPPMTSAEVENMIEMIENDSTTVEDEEPVEHMSKPHVLVYDDQQSVQEMNQFEPPMTSAQVQIMTENGSTTVEDKEPVEHRSIPHVLGDDQQSVQEMNQFEPPMTSAQVQIMNENGSTTVEDKEPVEHASKPHVVVYDDQEANQFEPPAEVQNMIENDSTTEVKEPVEHMFKPHICPSAQEINNVSIIDSITETDPSIQDLRVDSAVDTDARDQTFHKGISSQDQQNVQIEDFSFVVIDPSPEMTLPLFMPSDLRYDDMTCGVGEESGISSMAVSPELTDPGNHFSAMELPVMDLEPPMKEKPETQTSLFADDASLSVMGEVEAAMGFEPQPDPLPDRSDRDSFTVNQVGDQRVEMRSDEQDVKVPESVKEKRDCAENKETEKDETFAKTEINIMEATMDHNEWITDSNQHLPWMNLTLPSFGQHHTEEPKYTDSEPPCEVQQTHVLHENLGSRNVSVTFRVHYLTQSPFQKLAVTGNRPELGNWKGYVPLERAEDGHWAAAVSLPAKSLAQWKFVVVDQGEVRRWEECGNRLLDTTGCGEDVLVHKFWGFL
ncbi:uncharacterized protein stbd1 [Nerophis lumbriciformis]|uniref:uncharacterized protein stbd1 n=1 Tax=Nerophis lumbriciformis TaxID=546530 RepID=UPI003BAA8F9E